MNLSRRFPATAAFVIALLLSASCGQPVAVGDLLSVQVQESVLVFPEKGSVRLPFVVDEPGYVFDLQEGNRLVKSFHDGLEDFLVTDDGDFFGVNNFRALVYRNNGSTDGDPTSVIDMSDLLNDKPLAIRQIGDDVYLVGGMKIMKSSAKEFKFTETASIISDGLMLFDGALGNKDTGFAYMTDKALNRFVRFSISGKKPTLVKKLTTGIHVGHRDPLTVETAKNIYIEHLGNIWMVEQSGAGFVVVYNPKGVAELKNAAGKFIKQKE